jgi:hypothetical protein
MGYTTNIKGDEMDKLATGNALLAMHDEWVRLSRLFGLRNGTNEGFAKWFGEEFTRSMNQSRFDALVARSV